MKNFIFIGYCRDALQGGLGNIINHLRWGAALLVCTAHLRNAIFPDAIPGLKLSIGAKIFYFFTLFGTQSVTVFFVISGLLVGGKVVSGVLDNSFSVMRYFTDRISRLYVVLLPAFILSTGLMSVSGCEIGNWENILGNLFFLQNLSAQPLCNNHPLWSLSNEAFYYLVAGLVGCLCVYKKYKYCFFCAIVAVLFGVIHESAWGHTSFILASPAWLLGILPWVCRINISWKFLLVPVVILLLISRLHLFTFELLEDWSLAIAFALLLSADFSGCGRFLKKFGEWASGFSYSLYLIHMPFVVLIEKYVGKQDPNGVYGYLIYLACLAFIIGIAWVFGVLFEANTARVRGGMYRFAVNLKRRFFLVKEV